MKFCKSSLILLLFSSCFFEPHKPTQNELKETMNGAKFDTNILNIFSIYQSLSQVVSKNFDFIVPFEYYYNSAALGTNIKDMPNFVYKQVDSLWRQIGKDNIVSLQVYNNKTIIIKALMTKAPHNTLIVHQLIWNMQPFDSNHSFDLLKDTLLTKNCTYRLGVSQNHSGW
jgi:hypothetical protein